jgi:hypothetical protein
VTEAAPVTDTWLLFLLVVTAVGLQFLLRAREQRPPARGRHVVVNLDAPREAVRGRLVRQYGRWLVLDEGAHLQDDGTTVAMGGSVALERAWIVSVQLLP